MGKKEFVEDELKKNAKSQSLRNKLKQLYIEYLETGSKNTLDDIVQVLMDLHRVWAKKRTFNSYEAYDVLTLGVTKAYNVIIAQRKNNNDVIQPEGLYSYVQTIFNNTLIDIIRKQKRGKIDEDLYPPEELIPLSLDMPADPSDPNSKSLLETLADTRDTPFDHVTNEERDSLFHDILVEYCRLFMNRRQSDLPHTLSLFYARVIPHRLDAISDYVATSPKWAWARMKDHSFIYLTDESESMTKEYISDDLAWCEELRSGLDKVCSQLIPPKEMKRVLAREIMDQADVGHWSNEVHKAVSKELFNVIRADPDFVSRAKAYIENTDSTFGGLLYGGKKQ